LKLKVLVTLPSIGTSLEILEEQKMLSINNGLITKAVEGFSAKLLDVESKLSENQVCASEETRLVNANLQRLKAIIDAQPRQIICEKRILLFPETYRHEFYKSIFGSIIKLFVIAIVTLFAFYFLKDLLIEHENEKFKVAWGWLYQHQTNKGKAIMDSAIFIPTSSGK